MRYNDWDVLLFPGDSIVPFKEFRVDCHLVHDIESPSSNGPTGLPTMTCFIPCLDAGTPFQLSIHSWGGHPEVSQFTKAFSKHAELVQFEARVFVDGCLVTSAILDPLGSWPCQLYNTFDVTRNGDLDRLRFPLFQYDILQQRGWSPADDLGRIRLVLSEGFPRGSAMVPVERVKNIVAFSFQYAPLSILEGSGLAWPSPSLWLHSPIPSSKPVPIYASDDGPLLHSHSPRRSKQPLTVTKAGASRGSIQSHRDQGGSRARPGPATASRRRLTSPGAEQAGRLGTYRTPPLSMNWVGLDPRNKKSSSYSQGSGKVSVCQQKAESDTYIPDYFGTHQDGHDSWFYFNSKSQYDEYMESDPNRGLPGAVNKVPANTPASTSTDDSSAPGKGNPFRVGNTGGKQVQAPAAGFSAMVQQSTMGQSTHTPTVARNIPLPPSQPGSAAGTRTCPHIREGELMCSDPFCGCDSIKSSGICPPTDGFGRGQQYSGPFIGTGIDGGSTLLTHVDAAKPAVSGLGSGSNHTRNPGADAAMGGLPLDSTNVAPTQGQRKSPGSKGLPPKSAFMDDILMQALARA